MPPTESDIDSQRICFLWLGGLAIVRTVGREHLDRISVWPYPFEVVGVCWGLVEFAYPRIFQIL